MVKRVFLKSPAEEITAEHMPDEKTGGSGESDIPDEGGKDIPEKYAGWHTVEIKDEANADKENSVTGNNVFSELLGRVGELNTFLAYWWPAVLISGLFVLVLLGYLIYRMWPGKRKNKKKVSRYLDRELKKELKRRRVRHGAEEKENLPEFANKLVDLYKKTDSSKQEHINKELERTDIVKDPQLFNEEYEKRGRNDEQNSGRFGI